MKIARVEVVGANVAYQHREVSSQVDRDGVTAGVIRMESDNGLVGWGEACSGADMASVLATVGAMAPFIVGGDPWRAEEMKRDAWHRGLWQFREQTGNFAWAGLDMAMLDLCGQHAGVPVHALLGGQVRESVDYFWYLSGNDLEELLAYAKVGLSRGYRTFYLKVGRNIDDDLERVFAVRAVIGDECNLRLDANGAWSMIEARRNLSLMEDAHLDFIEQPVRQVPLELIGELRRMVKVPVAANEGLWSEEQARARIEARVADVYCFSPYWVGSLRGFQRLGFSVYDHGGQVCKHTHGELAIAATAAHHVMLTLPAIVEGNQQTAAHMVGDIVAEPLPLAKGPTWGAPTLPGLGVEVDAAALGAAAQDYERDGQFLPYQMAT
ncbi:MAG TPA: mandelate racemase/muconate lactonizing enzyme family protein [Acidimicrobiales bacterium]